MAFKFSPFRKIQEFFYGLYMESGFIDTISTAPCNPGTFTPSHLEYNFDVAAYMGSIPFPLQGVITIEESVPYFAGQDLPERDSAVTGCSDSAKSDHITLCGELYEQAEPTYCVGTEIFRRKFIHQFIPPSNFSGKLQQFVQALYGSRRGDYSTEESYPLQNYPLFVNDVQLGYGFVPHTSGLLCGPDYTYYLINVGSTVTARELEPSDIGTDIRTHLLTHAGSMTAEEIRKVESYLLSTCRVSATAQAVSVDLSSVIGEPAAYGWQFNGDGTKADIILHRDNLPTDQNWHAYHYRLDFSVTAGIVSALLTEVSANAVWSSVHGSNVLRPEYLTGNMEIMTNPKDEPFSGWPNLSTYEAPVYCFYNDSDELQVYSVKSTNSPSQDIATTYPARYGVQSGYVLLYRAYTVGSGKQLSILKNGVAEVQSINTGTVTNDRTYWYDYSGTTEPASLGFNTLPVETHPGELVEGSGLTVREYAEAQGWFIPGGPLFPTGQEGPNGETIYLGAASRSNSNFSYIWTSLIGSSSSTAKTSLIIPHRSCKSVSTAVKNRYSVSGSSRYSFLDRNVLGLLRTKAECHYFDYYTPSGGGSIVYQNIRGPFGLTNRQFGSESYSEVNNYNSVRSEVEFNASTAKNFESILQFSVINQFQYDMFFDFNYITDPFGYFFANAKSSLMSADYIQLGGDVPVFNKEFINDLACGWA